MRANHAPAVPGATALFYNGRSHGSCPWVGEYRMKSVNPLLMACALLAAPLAMSAEFSGEFTFRSPDGVVNLTLQQGAQGQVTGSMSDGVSSLRLEGRANGDDASGRFSDADASELGFTLQFADGGTELWMQVYPLDAIGEPMLDLAETLAFVRRGGDATPAATPGENDADSNVFVNGKALSQGEVASFEQQYQTNLIDGRFWYDNRCGAWGVDGGPTVGFIHPGLPLPGPMPENISGGGTGIFINGRELHPVDRQTLVAMFGTAIPGRYWLDAYGNLGVEGGGFVVNLAVAAQQLQRSTTQTSRGTVSTESSGAMFSGRNLSTGKPTFWYSGM